MLKARSLLKLLFTQCADYSRLLGPDISSKNVLIGIITDPKELGTSQTGRRPLPFIRVPGWKQFACISLLNIPHDSAEKLANRRH